MIRFSRKDGHFGEFSNFYDCGIEFDGLRYKNSEAAFQAQKTLNLNERRKFCNVNPSEAKRLGRQVCLRNDWESIKFDVMCNILYAKFSQHEDLRNLLLSTGDEGIVENTTGWHDNIWGNCDCDRCRNKVGQNLLGQALMHVRTQLRE